MRAWRQWLPTPRPPISDPALANRIATFEGDLKALGERVGVLGRRNDEIASIAGEARSRADAATAAVAELKKAQTPAAPVVERKEIEALNTRIAALERAAKAMEAQLAGRSGGDGADRSLRLVVVASTLNAAVERGAPFVAELAAAKAAAPDPKLLAALEPFASSGVPTTAALTRELTALMPAVAKAVGTSPRDGGILDRLKASAEKVVSIRPIDETPGDEPAAIVRRIEIRAEQGNLNGAMAEMAKLPEGARALTKEWVAQRAGAQRRGRGQPAVRRRCAGVDRQAITSSDEASMIRVVFYLLIVGLLAAAFVWLADRPGDVVITWQGQRIETVVMYLVLAVLVVAVLLNDAVVDLPRDPALARDAALPSAHAARHARLSRGVAGPDRGRLRRRALRAPIRRRGGADRAQRAADAAAHRAGSQLSGDRDAAARTFNAMAARDDTRLLGLHGLYIEAQRRNDTAAAKVYAEEAAGARARRPGRGSRCSTRAAPPATGSARWSGSTAT